MSNLIIRIIGGVCGGAIGLYISGQIYDKLYNNKPPKLLKNTSPAEISLSQKDNENKAKDISSFENILNIQIQEIQTNNINDNNLNLKNDTVNISPIIVNNNKNEELYINDAIYDNTYYDFYIKIGR